MNELKKILLLAICIIILIIIVLIVYIKVSIPEDEITDTQTGNYTFSKDDIDEINEKKQENLIQRLDYFVINNCMQQFLNISNINNGIYYGYNENNEYVRTYTEDEIEEYIYNVLSEKFISENNIQKNNVFNYIDKFEQSVLLVPINIKEIQNNDNIKSYIIYGIIEDMQNYNYLKDIYAVINLDTEKLSYSVQILREKFSSINDIVITNLETNITENDVNTYINPKTTNEETIKNYINIYKRLSLGKSELAYQFLDEEYKAKRFGNLLNFQKYVENNKEIIQSMTLSKYKVEDEGDITRFIGIDNNGNYIIFNETNTLNFKVVLDTYTVDLPEFTEKYDEGNNKTKVELNIGKFIEALNNSDYDYIYKHLDEQFKSNNFKTINEFENYIKLNFYNKNSVNLQEYEEQNDVYIYDLVLKNSQNDAQSKSLRVVVKLLDNRDFVMSFSM